MLLPGYYQSDPNNSNSWRIVEKQVPRLGKKREEKIAEYDKKYGKNNWRFAWQLGGKSINFLEACEEYEKSYLKHFQRNRQDLEYLSRNALEVYDTNLSNIESGLDYAHQEDTATHIQDIAIRRIMSQKNLTFNGDKYIQIRKRSQDPVGRSLSPLNVAFHKPRLVKNLSKASATVEDFWQNNRVIQYLDRVIKS
jgi:hypothetical protein